MKGTLLIAGGGIGGLAAAVSARQAGWDARVVEQAESFSEVGAGIQLGPNATRILREGGLLQGTLGSQVARPARLRVMDAADGAQLAILRFDDFEQRYGAPYLTVHRAHLQAALLQAARDRGARTLTAHRIALVDQRADGVSVAGPGFDLAGDALVGADGIWSRVRSAVLPDEAPRATGHVAYRALLRQADLPQQLRSDQVTAWLGPRMHLVNYPVAGGDALNVVCFVHGRWHGDVQGWDHAAGLADLQAAMGPVHRSLRELVEQVPQWRLWTLHDRPPLASAAQMAAGRIALLGDAAHPMRPYLAQGAGMALEDARMLQQVLQECAGAADLPAAFSRYAQARWRRCARVQARSERNGVIFHAQGPLRLARNASLRLLGARVVDIPWLYAHAS